MKSFTWIGGAGNFSDPNWTDGVSPPDGLAGPPGQFDDATVNSGDTVAITSPADVLDLFVDNASTVDDVGSVLTVENVLGVGLTVDANSSYLNIASAPYVY